MAQEIHTQDGADFLRRFKKLPKRHTGKEVLVEFQHDGRFTKAFEEDCIALSLPLGETISQSSTHVEPSSLNFVVYAMHEMAERLLGLPKGTIINGRARTLFGIGMDAKMMTERTRVFDGLLILEILDAQPDS